MDSRVDRFSGQFRSHGVEQTRVKPLQTVASARGELCIFRVTCAPGAETAEAVHPAVGAHVAVEIRGHSIANCTVSVAASGISPNTFDESPASASAVGSGCDIIAR